MYEFVITERIKQVLISCFYFFQHCLAQKVSGVDCRWGATAEQTLDCGGHTDAFLEPVDSAVHNLYSKFGEFSVLLLFNSVWMWEWMWECVYAFTVMFFFADTIQWRRMSWAWSPVISGGCTDDFLGACGQYYWVQILYVWWVFNFAFV